MKRIDNGQERKIYYCKVFKEDIQLIIDLMTINGEPPQLACEEYEFADANELFSFLGEMGKHEIQIRCREPMVRLSSAGYMDYVSVRTPESTDAGIALVHRVSEVLCRCEGRKPLRARRWFFMIGNIIFWSSVVATVHTKKIPVGLLTFSSAIVGMLIMALCLTYNHRKANTLYGVTRNSRKSFLQRKGDDLLVSLISGAVGAALGAILGVAGTLLVQAHTANDSQKNPVQSAQSH